MKLTRKEFKAGDKIVALPEAVFIYKLPDCVLEVEHQLVGVVEVFDNGMSNLRTCDTYAHIFKVRKGNFTNKKSFAIDSKYFRLATESDISEYLLEEL